MDGMEGKRIAFIGQSSRVIDNGSVADILSLSAPLAITSLQLLPLQYPFIAATYPGLLRSDGGTFFPI